MRAQFQPGPFRRLTRNRLALLATVVLAGFGPAASGITEQAQFVLAETVGENWRGAYDLLVRPSGARTALEVGHKLVEPNFLTFTGAGGITIDQLDAIRQIVNVEVAAPIAVVGFIQMGMDAPILSFDGEVMPSDPALFRAETKFWTSDGVTETILGTWEGEAVLPPPGWPEWPQDMGWYSFPGGSGNYTGPPGTDWSSIGEFLLESPMPPVFSPLVAVDPGAEEALVGSSVAFLGLLRQVGEDQRTAGVFNPELIHENYPSLAFPFYFLEPSQRDKPVIPMVVSEKLYAPLIGRVDVWQVGDPLPEIDDTSSVLTVAQEMRTGAPLHHVGASEEDFSSNQRPFADTYIRLSWPGSGEWPEKLGQVLSAGLPQKFVTRLPGPLNYLERGARPSSAGISLQVEVPRVGRVALPQSRTNRYRPLIEIELAEVEVEFVSGPQDYPWLFAPLGEFDLETVVLPDNPLNWAPLGAYEAPESWWVADADGVAVEPVAMTPTFDVTGLIQPPPLAFTDLLGAQVLRGDAPIDAIRVRVSGLTGYDEKGRERVADVASQIAALGLDVDIMAGSSPQPVELYVPSYYPDGSDLGWVQQGWSTLGAAGQVVEGFSRINNQLLILAVATAAVVAGGMHVVGSSSRTAHARVLQTIGWSRTRRITWLTGQAFASASIIVAVGVLVWAWRGLPQPAIVAIAVIAAIIVGAALAAAIAVTGSRQSKPKRSSRRLARAIPPLRPVGYAARRLVIRPGITLVMVAALTVGVTALGVAVTSVTHALTQTGPTLLSRFSAGVLRPHQIAMLALTATAGIGLFILIQHIDRKQRREERTILKLTGLNPRKINRIRTHELSLTALLAAPPVVLLADRLTPASTRGPALVITLAVLATTPLWATPSPGSSR